MESRLIILAKICLMLLVKIQFGRPKPKLLNQNPLTRAQRLNLVLQCSGGNKTKAKMLVAFVTGLTGSTTGLTGSSRVLQNKSKPKMVKPKKPEIGVWKTVQAKGRHKRQKEKPKPFLGDLPAKFRKRNNASRLKHPKHSRSTPIQQFNDRNR